MDLSGTWRNVSGAESKLDRGETNVDFETPRKFDAAADRNVEDELGLKHYSGVAESWDLYKG